MHSRPQRPRSFWSAPRIATSGLASAIHGLPVTLRMLRVKSDKSDCILVPRGRAPFGQHQESRPLAGSNTGSPRFTDFPSLCACSESSLTNLIGCGLNLLCLQSHSKTECCWTRPEVAILGADQKERGLWGREWKARAQTNPGRVNSRLDFRRSLVSGLPSPSSWEERGLISRTAAGNRAYVNRS